jgi:hypothetical protein
LVFPFSEKTWSIIALLPFTDSIMNPHLLKLYNRTSWFEGCGLVPPGNPHIHFASTPQSQAARTGDFDGHIPYPSFLAPGPYDANIVLSAFHTTLRFPDVLRIPSSPGSVSTKWHAIPDVLPRGVDDTSFSVECPRFSNPSPQLKKQDLLS